MYKIVKAITIPGMEHEMTKYLKDGWLPAGGITKSFGIFMQAIYKINNL